MTTHRFVRMVAAAAAATVAGSVLPAPAASATAQAVDECCVTPLWSSYLDEPRTIAETPAAVDLDPRSQHVYVTGDALRRGGNDTSSGFDDTDIVTARYDAEGDLVWSRRFDGARSYTDRAADVAADGLGNVYVAGRSWRGYNFDGVGTEMDIVLLKYGPTGTLLWQRYYDGPVHMNDSASAMALDADGNVYVTGSSTGGQIGVAVYSQYVTVKFSPAGEQQWARRYGPRGDGSGANDLAVDGAGAVYVTGDSHPGVGGIADPVTIKYTPSGRVVWTSRAAAADGADRHAERLAVDGQGNVFLTGDEHRPEPNRVDVLVLKHAAADGAVQWARTFDGRGYSEDQGWHVGTDGAGNVHVAAASMAYEFGGRGTDVVTIKYDAAGQRQWYRTLDGPTEESYDIPRGFHVDDGGHVYLLAQMEPTATTQDLVFHRYTRFGDSVSHYTLTTPPGVVEDAGMHLRQQQQDVMDMDRSTGLIAIASGAYTPESSPQRIFFTGLLLVP